MKLLYLILLLLLVSCNEVSEKQKAHVDSLNLQAYEIRYSDIDSTAHLARRAYDEAGAYSEGKARALNMLGYVAYQQMDFATAFARLDSVKALTSNQIILLVSDVMRMKINQRTGNGNAYFEARVSAQKRIKRAEEEYHLLSDADLHDLFFARTEFHIISSTYCFYQDQQQEAIEEMEAISGDFNLVTDSTQWLYYHYMLGSGGLIEGSPEDVALSEFDHLMTCYTNSRNLGVTYFVANSLQALASLLSDEQSRRVIEERSRDHYYMLIGHHIEWLPLDSIDSMSHLPEALALHAVYAFRQYKDLFQTACAYRTLGEISFKHGHYDQALDNYSLALDCVNEQFIYNNGFSQHPDSLPRLLSLYDDGTDGHADIELQWITSDSIYTVPDWIAGIRQKISMAFSALGMKTESDFNRNIYLDIIARTSQNVEMESRMTQLQKEADSLHFRLLLTALLFFLLIALIIFYARHLRKSNEIRLKAIQQSAKAAESLELETDVQHLEALTDEVEELDEQVQLYTQRIDRNKRRNAEKRAKVSLVHAVTPFLDRIINQNDRMQREGRADADKLQYIIELTDRIVVYNDILTDWIKMEKGELAMQIATIDLEPIFQTLQRGHYAFDQKGVTLDVQPTQLRVKADEALTLFMLNTLADNARKFTPSGGSVTICAEGYDNYVELSITDTGCGMAQEDVDTLNNSKVYDSRRIGSNVEGKGFGFGIMNCRGIIEKYRKTSSFFSVCHFEVESSLGKGSRFFFRLPRVLSFVFGLLLSTSVMAKQASREQNFYNEAYQMNLDGMYSEALTAAYQGIVEICPRLSLTHEEELESSEFTNEVDLFLQGDTLDYQLLISLRNEIALAALALNDWSLYQYNNTLCTSLYKLYHQDHTLPTYCEKLQQTQTTSRQLLVLLVLFSILLVILSLALLHRRMYLGKGLMLQEQLCQKLKDTDDSLVAADLSDLQTVAQHLLHVCFEGMNNWQHIEGMQLRLNRVEDDSSLFVLNEGNCTGDKKEYEVCQGAGLLTVYGLEGYPNDNLNQVVYNTLSRVVITRVIHIAELLEAREQRSDEVNHLRYEEHRIYVQNQILDNCLSTIKHESMYYPSRIQQLAQRLVSDGNAASADDLQQLHELSYYYKDVYQLLSSQADKLTSQAYYRKESLSLPIILARAQKHFAKLARKHIFPLELDVPEIPDMIIFADAVLMEELIERFNLFIIKRFIELTPCDDIPQPQMLVRLEGNCAKLIFRLYGIIMDETQAHTLFYPESGHVNLLIAKQIVRELDALNNFPGLRLVAECHETYTDIWFTIISISNR